MERYVEKLFDKINSTKLKNRDGKLQDDPLLAERLKEYILSFKDKSEDEERHSAKGRFKFDENKDNSTEFITARVSRAPTKFQRPSQEKTEPNQIAKSKSKKDMKKSVDIDQGVDLGEKYTFNVAKSNQKFHK